MSYDAQAFVDYLKQFVGTPYVWGGNSLSSGIDCSGLVQQGLKKFGVNVARVTNDQIGQGTAVSYDNMKVGDLMFFDTDANRSGPDHVGVYMGNGMMIDAPRPGKSVEIVKLSSYYTSRFMGARRPDGATINGNSYTDAGSDTTVAAKLSPEEMAGQYGWAYSFLNSDPSLKTLFGEAVSGSWAVDKFQAKLRETDFWKNNSATARQQLQLKQSDPATWSANLDAAKVKIQQLAATAGASLTDKQLSDIADQSLMFGMDDAAINNVLGGYVDYIGGTLKGAAGAFEHNMRQYADSMGVDLNDQAIKNQAALMIRGLTTQQDFQGFVQQQATSLFPAYADQIKAGVTVKNIANPYVQTMAQTLEMNPNAITLKDPTIMSALNGMSQDGKPTGKSLVDFQDSLRADPRWRSTKQTQDKTMSIGSSILKAWGLTT